MKTTLTRSERKLVREYEAHLQRAKETRYDHDDATVAEHKRVDVPVELSVIRPITPTRRLYNRIRWQMMKHAVHTAKAS